MLGIGLLTIALAGCGSGSSPAGAPSSSARVGAATLPLEPGTAPDGTRTWVGTVDGTDAFVAVLAESDGRAIAYLCDGEQIVQYLDGRVAADALSAKDRAGTALTATVTDGALTGTATLPDGSAHRFTAPIAAGGAGMWWLSEEIDDGVRVGGWIRTADGAWRGRSGDVVIKGTKIDGTSGGPRQPTTTEKPSGTVIIDGCPVSLKGPSDVIIKGTKIDDNSQTVSTRNVTANQAPPADAHRTTDVDAVRCSLLFKPDISMVIKGRKISQN